MRTEAETKKAAIVTREELYRQVWETPISRLAEKYGVSGNGLKKICDRLHVPYPPRGYWAKLAAGRPVSQHQVALLVQSAALDQYLQNRIPDRRLIQFALVA